MQGDGNLVVYTGGQKAVWSSKTDGNPGAYVIAQGDGNVVIYKGQKALWATNTVVFKPPGNSSGGSNPHPGCRFARTDTKCFVFSLWCKAVWSCGFDSNLNPIEQSDSWHPCGACAGLSF